MLKSKRIEVCGNIASGKTSLVNILSNNEQLEVTPILENFKSNPFWADFYSFPEKYIFQTELTFTLQHFHEIIKHGEDNSLLCDYSLELDRAYAHIGLQNNRLSIYENTVSELYQEAGYPSHLVHLKCNPEELLSRVKKRNREVEQSISIDFLTSLDEAINKNIKELSNVKILEIESDLIDYVHSTKDRDFLLNEVINFLVDNPTL